MIALVQRHLEAIYDVEAPDVRDFLVPEEALADLIGERRVSREWVLVREEADNIDIGVYIHADDMAAVDGLSPERAVRDAMPAWAAVTEGVSHFLLLARRAAREEPVSLLELEAQAEVDKFVTARLHIGSDPMLRRRLFHNATLAEGLDGAEIERYREAGRLADRYCERLEKCRDVGALLEELRVFYRMSGAARMERLRRVA